MKILFIAPYVPSLIRVRPFNLIRSLSDQHDVSVLAIAPPDELDRVAALRPYCERVEVVPLRKSASLRSCALAALRGDPLQSAYCAMPEVGSSLRRLLSRERFDVAHVEHLRAAFVGKLLPPTLPRLYDSVDCISLLLERTRRSSHSLRQRGLAYLEHGRTQKFEAQVLARFDQTIVTSEDDLQALRALAPDAPIVVVANGVDLDYFQPSSEPREPATIVFSGKMSYHANATAALHFARDVFPRVLRARPDARFRIVGSDPAPEIRALGADPAIEVTGYVDDLRAAVGRATIAVCPVTVKVGIQNKVLEAMAMATPVVSSRPGASGLAALPGRDFLVAEDDVDFAAQVVELLADSERRSQIGWEGRRFVERHHRWEVAADQLASLYRDAIERRRDTRDAPHPNPSLA